MLLKCCTQYANKFGKLSSGHRTGKFQFSFQSQRKAMPKNVQATTQLYSSHMLASQYSKLSKWGFRSMWTGNFKMFKLDLEKVEKPEINLPTFVGSLKKSKRIPEKHLLLLHWLCQILCCVDHNKLWKILRDGNIRSPYLPPEKPGADQEATVRTRHGKVDWFQTGKGVCQVCMLSPCLFNLCAKHVKWNARLDERQAGIKNAGRIINDLRYADDTTLTAESEEELKNLLMKVKEGNEKAGLKLSIQKKLRSWHLVPSLHGKYMGKQWKQ